MDIEKYYTENYNQLINRVKRRCGGVINAEDVVQEAFARAIKYKDSFDDQRRPYEAWFNTILNNSLRDFQRQERLYGMNLEFEEEKIDGVSMKEIRATTGREIHRLIAQQEEPKRTILNLHFNRNYTTREIAEVEDVPLGTIFTTINRFKKEVMEKYAASMDGGLGS